jgi:diguanylate cyclase (GGDEF)-like protein/PAS domain S-box-containing protein
MKMNAEGHAASVPQDNISMPRLREADAEVVDASTHSGARNISDSPHISRPPALGGRVPAFMVLALSLAVTALAWESTRRVTNLQVEQEFAALVREISGDIHARMTAFEVALHASRAFILASQHITREDWLIFQDTQRFEIKHPGTLGIGLAREVRHADVEKYVRSVREEDRSNYRIWPDGARAVYAPVRFTASHNRDTRALGYDMYTEPRRRGATERARDSGEAALSGVVRLVSVAGDKGRQSILLFLPVYSRTLASNATVEQRRAALVSYVYCPLLIGEFMRDLADKISSKNLAVRITDAEGSSIFAASTESSGYGELPSIAEETDVYGQKWTIRFQALPEFSRIVGEARATLVAGSGFIISLLLFAIIWTVTSTRLRAEVLAMAMTRDLRESETRFRNLTELSSDWYWEQDDKFRYTIMSGGVHQRTGRNVSEVIGKARWELPGIELSDEEWAKHKACLEAHEPFLDFTFKRVRPDGPPRFVSLSGRPLFDAQGKFKGYRGVGKDITEARAAEERIQYLAYHDGLTSLPNRSMFSQLLNHGISRAHRYNKKLAVLFIDLDRFKNINDTLGHEAGDLLLQQVGTRLKECLRQSDTVARLGGDEFVVLLEEVGERQVVATIAHKILSTIIKPFNMLGQEFRVTASIGISAYPDDGQDEQTLMKNADIAMYRAKEEGKNNFQFHSAQMDTHTFERLALESSLRRALERNEFQLHYQAKMDLRTGRMTGMEALIRWVHPDLGMVSPAQFIPLAEETGLIVPIGKWVLRTACLQNKAWQDAGLPPLPIAVNLSARQFIDENLLSDIAAIIDETRMDAGFLELEITESMVMHRVDRAVQILTDLKKIGIRLAIDDFGTGYSSLSNLKRFPIDTIKVDRSFIRDIPGNAEDKALTKAIIAMGQTLSLTVTAEGVETQEQIDFLRQHSCNEFQGYYFNRPVPAEDFAQLMRTQTSHNLPAPENINGAE